MREEKARQDEQAKKYRDRARERREVIANEEQYDISAVQQAASTGNYKSVAPDSQGNFDAAARRKQMIDESKFLGGDLEHTHLVKGLDYALLQKVNQYYTRKASLLILSSFFQVRAEIGEDDVDNDPLNSNKDENVFVKPTAKM